jgi:hypothetical protein
VVYDKLGRHADAEAELGRYRAANGDGGAYQYATIYAQWGNRTTALEGLDTAMRLRDSGLVLLKTDPLMDPLRKEPRFQAIERALKFPDWSSEAVNAAARGDAAPESLGSACRSAGWSAARRCAAK